MDNKYYTPSLEELHIGFTYYDKDDKGNWELQTMAQEDFNFIFSDFEHEHDGKFCDLYKVKYLDKVDIESLGFDVSLVAYQELSYPIDYKATKEDAVGTLYCIYFYSQWEECEISNIPVDCDYEIEIKKYRSNAKDFRKTWDTEPREEVMFKGIIKNKSELKKLLKQLNV